MNLHTWQQEPVWKEDIIKEVEYLGEGVRSLHLFYYQMKAQGAPESLLNELGITWNELEATRQRLAKLIPCFPSEPKNGP